MAWPTPKWMRALVAVAALGILAPPCARACFYSPSDFNATDSSQASLRTLLQGHYEEQAEVKNLKQILARLAEIEPQATAAGAAALRDEYALLLHRTGKRSEAEALWRSILQAEPNRFETLCNLGSALEMVGRSDEATSLIAQAAALKPGFRDGAEELHAAKSASTAKLRRGTPAGEAFFLPHYAAAWAARAAPPQSFPAAELGAPGSVDGLVELLRQYPTFGDGWHALAIALEHSGDTRSALTAYRRATRHGATFRRDIDVHVKLLGTHEDSKKIFERAGSGMLAFVASLIALFLLYRYGPVVRDVVDDLRKAYKDRKND